LKRDKIKISQNFQPFVSFALLPHQQQQQQHQQQQQQPHHRQQQQHLFF